MHIDYAWKDGELYASTKYDDKHFVIRVYTDLFQDPFDAVEHVNGKLEEAVKNAGGNITQHDLMNMSVSDFAEFRKQNMHEYGVKYDGEGILSSLTVHTPQYRTIDGRELQSDGSLKAKPKKRTYKDAYWDFVDSTDAIKAAEFKAELESLVTMDLEPTKDMHSWVEDKPIVKPHRAPGFMSYVFEEFRIPFLGGLVIFLLLHLLGIIS